MLNKRFQYDFILFSILVILLTSNLSSQTIIEFNDFQKMFSQDCFYISSYSGNIDLGKTGGPNIYDYSNLTLQNEQSNIYSISTIPRFINHFPGEAITFGDSPTTIEKNPVFLFENNTAYVLGHASLIPNLQIVHKVPAEVIGVFPMTYPFSYSQNIEKIDSTFDGHGVLISTNSSNSNYVTTVDGWGTLKLGDKQFQCIRMKREYTNYGDKEFMYFTKEGALFDVISVPLTSPDTGTVLVDCQVIMAKSLVDVKEENATINSFNLSQNYPNPFNPSTTINYSILKDSKVKLSVYDLLGRELKVLVDEKKSAGSYKVDFNTSGLNLTSGVYFYRLQTDNNISAKKMILLK